MIPAGRGLLAVLAGDRRRRWRFDGSSPARPAPPPVAVPWAEELAREAEEAGDVEHAERTRLAARTCPPMSGERARRGASFRRLVDRDED